MAAVISPTAGTRTEPMDNYKFVRGSTAVFKTVFLNDDKPTKVDVATTPQAFILEPMFLNRGTPVPTILAVLDGSLVPGQEFEYQFSWDIPVNQQPLDEYIITYSGTLGGVNYNFGDEYFAVLGHAGVIGMKTPTYATVADVRMAKFNIDSFLPQTTAKDLTARNQILEFHLRNASNKLREELTLFKQKGNSDNYRLFCIYYTIYCVLLAARGEDGSSVSDQNLAEWKGMWQAILAQEKRQSGAQGIPLGRG
jgi:hypothetical protein